MAATNRAGIADKEPAEDIVARVERLRNKQRDLAENRRNRELLKQLPQGHGSGLDADTVDKMHAEQIIAEARRGIMGGGGGGLNPHLLSFHSDILLSGLVDQQLLAYEAASKKWKNISVLPDAAYPNAVLLDGSRPMDDFIDLGPYGFLTEHLAVTEYDDDTLEILDRTLAYQKNLRVNVLGAYYFTALGVTFYFQTKDTSRSLLRFQAWNSDTEQYDTMGQIKAGASPLWEITKAGNITAIPGKTVDFPNYKVGGVAGADGSFTTADNKTVTVTKGLITSIV